MQIFEPALHPSPGAATLLFPIADDILDRASPRALMAHERPLPLVYIGNQYDRDRAFTEFFAPAAAHALHWSVPDILDTDSGCQLADFPIA